MKRQIAFAIFMLATIQLISFCSAVDVSPSSLSINVNSGNSVQRIFTLTTTQSSENVLVALGSYSSWISFSSYSIDVVNGSSSYVTMTINVPSNTATGIYNLNPSFNSIQVPISLNVTNPSDNEGQPADCNLDIFPTTLQNVKVSQGDKITRNIQLTVPGCFTSSISVSAVSLSTNQQPIELGELSLGSLSPSQSLNIPISIDAENTPTGTYSDNLQFLIYNSTGIRQIVSPVYISVLVTAGISPVQNLSASDIPSCSLDGTEFAKNSTHTLTCTINNPNIEIYSDIDDNYIKGIDIQPSSTQWVYRFQAIKTGNTFIKTKFYYQGGQVGTPFSQEVKISASGNTPISGTNLKLKFYQNDLSANLDDLYAGNITFRVYDNNTDNVIEDYTALLNGNPVNGTFSIYPFINYELSVSAEGYLGKIINLNVSHTEIPSLSISGTYELNSPITINGNTSECNIFYDGIKQIGYQVYPSSLGEHEIQVICPNMETQIFNFTAIAGAVITTENKFKKGQAFSMTFDHVTNYQVLYSEKNNNDSQKQVMGVGMAPSISYTPDKSGYYYISYGDNMQKTYHIGSSLGFLRRWYSYVIYGILFLGLVVVFFVRRANKNRAQEIPFESVEEM